MLLPIAGCSCARSQAPLNMTLRCEDHLLEVLGTCFAVQRKKEVPQEPLCDLIPI